MKRYKVKYQKNNKTMTTYLSEEEYENFSLNHNILSVKIRKNYLYNLSIKKMKSSEVLDFFLQLDMMLKANLTFYDALKVLEKSLQNRQMIFLVHDLISCVEKGENPLNAFKKYEKELDTVIVNFFKILKNQGEIKQTIHSICKILKFKQESKKLLYSSLSYPLIIFITLLFALGIIFIVVVPKFEFIFSQYDMQLPIYTQALLFLKYLFISYGFYMSMFFIGLFSFGVLLYQKSTRFSFLLSRFMAKKVFIFSEMYQLWVFYNFFVSVHILLENRFEFNSAIKNSSLLIKNKYLLAKIQKINHNISNGMTVYQSFLLSNIFDEMVLNLINTGESSASMLFSVKNIESMYRYNFEIKIKRIATLIEPIFFAFIMLFILWVMLAIFTPIWNMNEMIKF